MGKLLWFVIAGVIILVSYVIFNHVRKNGWIDIMAGLFIMIAIFFFGGLLLAILKEK